MAQTMLLCDYQEDFEQIEKKFIDTGLVQWVFHPYPQDEVTMAAFVCMPALSMEKRRVLLDALLKEANNASPSLLLEMVKGFASKIGKKVPDPREGEVSGQEIEAFVSFLSETEIEATPLLSVNGVLRMDLRPNLKDIQQEALRYEKK
jgi:protein-disulfide isomerase